MRALVFVYPLSSDIKTFFEIKPDDYIIAVDRSLENLIAQDIKPDIAIGDFDSLKDLSLLKDINAVTLDKIKDETDSYIAIEEAYKIASEVILIGGVCGERVEHFVAHLMLFDRFPHLKIVTENSIIKLLQTGTYNIKSKNFISLFSFEEAIITLKGFKYNLSNYILKPFDPLCISNEVIEEGIIEIKSGRILYIDSKK